MKKIVSLSVVLILIIVLSGTAFAGFRKGDTYLGVSLGLNYFVSSPIFGANLEIALNKNWGIGGLVRYWTWGDNFVTYSFDYTFIFVGGQLNYHFKFLGPKTDFYVGASLGYGIFSYSSSNASFNATGSSKLLFGLHAGIRFTLSKNMFLTGRVMGGGSDFGGLEIGLDFRL